jgi:hypothetical protein
MLHFYKPALHLAGHSIELALKSHLRAKGHSLSDLSRIRHSLMGALDACKLLGIEAPSEMDWHYLNFLSEAHEHHEFRYSHLDHPPYMEREDWARLAEWALRVAAPAVAASQPGSSIEAMLARIRQVFASG